ncbi:MAG: 5'/3'-nucleotidase SurE, partial [Nitrospinota bacterium]
MRILLSNDDSINAPGINAMKQELEKRGADVTMVAPETEMSAIGHAITIASPLRVRKVVKEGLLFGYGVNGTPADCVKIGVREIMKDAPPDLIVSGLNQGQNVAT